MKKNLLIVLIGLASVSMAQESNVGIKGGLNLANTTGGEISTDMRISIVVGGYYNYMIGEKFGLQPELVYSAQGSKTPSGEQSIQVGTNPITGDPIYATVDLKERTTILDYINVPILAKYYFSNSFKVLAGPQVGLLVRAVVKDDDTAQDIKENTESFDFSFAVGLGYELENGINFDARYNAGLTAINSEGDDSITNMVIQITVGYQF